MTHEPIVFNGGESPLAPKAKGAAAKGAAEPSSVPIGSNHSSGGAAPNPAKGSAKAKAVPSDEIGEPPLGGVVRARKK